MSKLSSLFHKNIEPIIVKIKNSDVVEEAFTLAQKIIPQVLQESLAHPGWTDDDRRNEVVRLLKEQLTEKYPNSGWAISIAVDFAVEHLRSLLAKKAGN